MAENTKIEWADHTFNPWTGCTKVSPACDHCYAEGWAKRSGHVEWGPHGARRRTQPATWAMPRRWNETAAATGVRPRMFCASLADVFDNHRSILPEWRADLWTLIRETPHLDWLLLTKRPQNIARMLPGDWGPDGYRNVWLGTTVENQAEYERRVPALLDVPARVRFLSCEPLLGPVRIKNRYPIGEDGIVEVPALDWVIAGGESGAGARPSHPDWFRDLRDQCAAAGVAFHFKQWGDWASVSEVAGEGAHFTFPDHATVRRVGKKVAGRTLDGVLHDGLPA